MHIIDLIVFFLFTGGIVLFGCSFFRKKGITSDEFTSGGRNIPGWVVGMSIFATYVSSISYLGYPGKAFASDWNAFVFLLSIPLASWVAARYFVPFYRRQCNVSAYTFLEERFGRWARLYASMCYLLTQIARMGSILFLLAMPMNVLMGWNIQLVIVITSIAIIIYSLIGGIKAVIWTEALQGIILICGAVACLCVILFSMPESPMQVMDIAMAEDKFSLGSMSMTDWSTSTFWVCLIYGIFINLQNYGIDQNYVQRYHTAATDNEAKKAALFGGYLAIPMSAVFFFIGTALYAYYKVHEGELPEGIKADYVFPFFIVNNLPVGMTGLLIASIFAAGMSTVATSVTSSSTILLTECPLKRICSDIVSLRIYSVIVGLAGMIIAIALVNVDSILDAWWKLSSIFSGGMLGLFLLGFVTRNDKHQYSLPAIVAVVMGCVVIAWISADEWLNLPDIHLHEYLAIVLGTMTIFIAGFVLISICKKRYSKG